jgi:thiol:disulfide interchange protein DsbC
MRFLAKAAIAFSAIAFGTAFQVSAAGDEESRTIKATLEKRFPGVEIESIAPAPWEGLYEVVTAGEIVYTNKDAKLLFSGQILDTTTKENLTKRSWNERRRIDFSSLPLDQAIKIVKGKGTRKLAVFEDPLCPFCAKFEKELKEVDDATVYVFLLPLEDIHPGATQVAQKIWCSKDRAAAWERWMQDRQANDDATCATNVIEQVRTLADKLKINSTPTMYFESGYRNSGAVAAKELEQLFKSPD